MSMPHIVVHIYIVPYPEQCVTIRNTEEIPKDRHPSFTRYKCGTKLLQKGRNSNNEKTALLMSIYWYTAIYERSFWLRLPSFVAIFIHAEILKLQTHLHHVKSSHKHEVKCSKLKVIAKVTSDKWHLKSLIINYLGVTLSLEKILNSKLTGVNVNISGKNKFSASHVLHLKVRRKNRAFFF